MKDKVHTIRVDEEGRYILLIQYPSYWDGSWAHEAATLAQKLIAEWWESGDKFTVIPMSKDTKIKVERVGKVVGE